MSKKIYIDKEQIDKEEKRDAFMDKAAKNKANNDLHKKLIDKYFNNWQSPQNASIENYYKSGKVGGTLFLALMEYAEEYHSEKIKQIATEQDLISKAREKEKEGEKFTCTHCGSNKTYKTEAYHCNMCAMTTEI